MVVQRRNPAVRREMVMTMAELRILFHPPNPGRRKAMSICIPVAEVDAARAQVQSGHDKG